MSLWRCGPLVAAACVGCASPPAAKAPPFRPVVDVKQLMEAVVDPSADVVWGAAGSIVTATGTTELGPSTEGEWTRVRHAALALAESGNLLMMAPRAKDGEAWMKHSQELVEAGTLALKAAEAKDEDALLTAGGRVYDACAHCHETYVEAITGANR